MAMKKYAVLCMVAFSLIVAASAACAVDAYIDEESDIVVARGDDGAGRGPVDEVELLAQGAPDERLDLLQRAKCVESLRTSAIQAEDAKDFWLWRIAVHPITAPRKKKPM